MNIASKFENIFFHLSQWKNSQKNVMDRGDDYGREVVFCFRRWKIKKLFALPRSFRKDLCRFFWWLNWKKDDTIKEAVLGTYSFSLCVQSVIILVIEPKILICFICYNCNCYISGANFWEWAICIDIQRHTIWTILFRKKKKLWTSWYIVDVQKVFSKLLLYNMFTFTSVGFSLRKFLYVSTISWVFSGVLHWISQFWFKFLPLRVIFAVRISFLILKDVTCFVSLLSCHLFIILTMPIVGTAQVC